MAEICLKKSKKNHKGYVIITVLILMMVLATVAYMYANSIFTEMAIARNNKGAAIAFSLAEAGTQEAIYRVQKDETAKNNFQNTVNGTTTFSHDPALVGNGSYSVTIQNSAQSVATITSVGTFKMGLRSARREIKLSIAQAEVPPPYSDDGAFFSDSAGGNSTGDLEFSGATVTIHDGGIHSGRDISFKDSTITAEKSIKAERTVLPKQASVVNCDCLLADDGDDLTPQCSDNPGCTYSYSPSPGMPMIDFDSASANSYKNQAISQNQYYVSESDFFSETGFTAGTSKTFNGVLYIENGLTLSQGRTLTVNGVLATSGSISIGENTSGTLILNRQDGSGAAGAIAIDSIALNDKGTLSGTGLLYSGFRFDVNDSNSAFTFHGGILSRRVYFGKRVVDFYFDRDVINSTLSNPSATPVIEINHWEEEY